MNDRLGETLQPLTQLLERLDVLYFVVGSVASTTLSIARMTQDIDVVANLRREQLPFLLEELNLHYFVDEEMIKREVARQGTFNIIHRNTFFKVDVFPLKSRDYDQTVAKRRQFGPLGNPPFMEAYLPQPEDVVLTKLEWFVATGRTSENQWGDIANVLKMQCFNLDLVYLQHWARELGVSDLLNKALDEAGITEETESNGDSD
jgi:hypothetical protein